MPVIGAAFMPRLNKIALLTEDGSIELTLPEAEAIVVRLSEALVVARGQHLIQVEAVAPSHRSRN